MIGLSLNSARGRLRANWLHAGIKRMQMVSRVQYNGRAPSASQPSTSSKNVAGSTKLRRRFSKIFHREMDEIGFGACSPDSSVTLGNSHPAICQSPRSQRCLRRVEGREWGGIILTTLKTTF